MQRTQTYGKNVIRQSLAKETQRTEPICVESIKEHRVPFLENSESVRGRSGGRLSSLNLERAIKCLLTLKCCETIVMGESTLWHGDTCPPALPFLKAIVKSLIFTIGDPTNL